MPENEKALDQSSEAAEDISKTSKKNGSRAAYWIRTAEDDFQTAQIMFDNDRYIWVGFLCHLIVEKALKAIIAKGGVFPPKSHDLSRLAKLGGVYDELSEEQKQFLDRIMVFQEDLRCSDGMGVDMKLDSQKSAAILQKTKEIFIWTRNKLSL